MRGSKRERVRGGVEKGGQDGLEIRSELIMIMIVVISIKEQI